MTLLREAKYCNCVKLWRFVLRRQLSVSSAAAANTRHEEMSDNNSGTGTTNNDAPASPSGPEKNPWIGRIIYNSYLSLIDGSPRGFREKYERMKELPKIKAEEAVHAHQNAVPVALQMAMKEMGIEIPQTCDKPKDDGNKYFYTPKSAGSKVQFPYGLLTSMEFMRTPSTSNPDSSSEEPQIGHRKRRAVGQPVVVEESDASDATDSEWFKDYGTPNSSIPPSNVPCGGCGAILHCQDASIAGYMPSERFQYLTPDDLITETCQRCYFVKEHKAALNVNISKEDYPKILSQIKDKFALVVLMVDLLDFPCSIWPELVDIIGTNRPVILVGNKVDLLPQDSPKFLQQVRKCLLKTCEDVGLDQANIIHLELVSATTGYGIEQLIDAIFHRWGSKGDVYIMGCTNVGKSSLFNAFIQSDLCKVRVVDIMQRATISQWPGTTLNLLKFPMTRPSSGRMGLRAARLRQEKAVSPAAHRQLRKIRVRENRTFLSSTLIGHIGRSFVDKENLKRIEEMNTQKDLFSMPTGAKVGPRPPVINKMKSREELEAEYKTSKWCFDTPGAVADNQILDQLTLSELMKTLPKQIIEPRTYLMKVGWTLFVAGLARIDYVDGADDIRFTIFSSTQLPITIVLTEDAERVYREGLGSIVFGVPFGDKERIAQFPPLESTEFELDGDGNKCSCADIVISSTGWIAVTAGLGEAVLVKAFTPNGKGLFCRKPSLLPYSVNLRGKKVQGTPAYNSTRVFVET